MSKILLGCIIPNSILTRDHLRLLCSQIFSSDDYTPVCAETDEQFQGVLDVFPYRNRELDAAPFPKYFPFSGMVGQVYCQLEAFVRNCTDYADKLNLR